MRNQIIEKIEHEQLKKGLPKFSVGDAVRVHTRIREGDKERIQAFAGIVIARKGYGISETFTVRRISYGEGVERVFPMHSPFIEKIEIERPGDVRRAKLYYLRKRVGKQAMRVDEAAAIVDKAEPVEGKPAKTEPAEEKAEAKK
jgi:large subunit ribosomal protein L19